MDFLYGYGWKAQPIIVYLLVDSLGYSLISTAGIVRAVCFCKLLKNGYLLFPSASSETRTTSRAKIAGVILIYSFLISAGRGIESSRSMVDRSRKEAMRVFFGSLFCLAIILKFHSRCGASCPTSQVSLGTFRAIF